MPTFGPLELQDVRKTNHLLEIWILIQTQSTLIYFPNDLHATWLFSNFVISVWPTIIRSDGQRFNRANFMK